MRHILTSSLVLLLAACSTQPPYERPQVEVPAAWKEAAPRLAEDGRWWRIYRDQELDKVVEEAFAGNADLVVAAARVDEARALVAEAESFFFPRVDAQASAGREGRARRGRGRARSGTPGARGAGGEVLFRVARARRAGRAHAPHGTAARRGAWPAAQAP